MKNIGEVKTVVNIGNKEMMTGSFWGDCKRYHRIENKFYLVMCTDTVYIPDLSVNIFSAMRASTKGFRMTSEK